VAPPWKEEVLDSHAALGDVCFVLCAPQGPQNCGAVARVMQNFGVYDLRLVNPGPFVLERGDEGKRASSDDDDDEANVAPDGANARGGINSGAALGPDGLGHGDELPPALRPTLKARAVDFDEEDASSKTNDDDGTSDDEYTRAPLCEEAYRFACAADWLLADASRHDSHVDAIKDCTFVMATTARPRGNVPLVTARVAARMLVEESKRGKVAVLFGNERTGLTNEELAQAHACVAIPTAGQGSLCRKSLKYTGGTGPTSLNLSQAVGVLAYELFMAADAAVAETDCSYRGVAEGAINIPTSQLMTVGEKHTLKNELIAARRSLDVLKTVSVADEDDDDEDDDDDVEGDDREERGIERVLNAAPLQRRDAAALFQLARRVKAVSAVDASDDDGKENGGASNPGPLDEKVTRVVARLAENGETPSVKRARARVREALGLSLTDKEIRKAIRKA
jgi:tRNA C32,U32 (ribose-2'-O)-methylase TrmJ